MISVVQFILYVADQTASKEFYKRVFQLEPVLDVSGMTEFLLSDTCKVGLMPEQGIAKIITPTLPHPASGSGIPRCELYLYVDDVFVYYHRALTIGAKEISPITRRDWGNTAGYLADPDGHVIAFASKE